MSIEEVKVYSFPERNGEDGLVLNEELGEGDLGSPKQINEDHAVGQKSSVKSSLSSGWLGFLTLDYYQTFFDVTTLQVVERVLVGMFPRFEMSLMEKLTPTPDLYGPFWLAMTLTLTLSLSSNLSRVFHNVETWEFHFQEVTLIGTLIYGYTWMTPCLLWGWLWWRGNRLRYTLLQLISIYGYSQSVFVPFTLLMFINHELVRWILLVVSITLSGCVLLTALWRPLKTENLKISPSLPWVVQLAIGVLLIAFILHSSLWIGFKFIYFRSSVASGSISPTSLNSNYSSSTGL